MLGQLIKLGSFISLVILGFLACVHGSTHHTRRSIQPNHQLIDSNLIYPQYYYWLTVPNFYEQPNAYGSGNNNLLMHHGNLKHTGPLELIDDSRRRKKTYKSIQKKSNIRKLKKRDYPHLLNHEIDEDDLISEDLFDSGGGGIDTGTLQSSNNGAGNTNSHLLPPQGYASQLMLRSARDRPYDVPQIGKCIFFL